MKTICVISQKGGTGKTTTTAALGAGLHRAGLRVLHTDFDPQRNLSLMLGALHGPTIYDVLTGKCKTTAAIQTTAQGAIIPSDGRLSEKGMLTGRGAEYRLRDAMEPIRKDFDAALIDCPPNLGALTIAALTAADGAIVPCKPDRFSMDALHEIAGTIDVIRNSTNRGLKIFGVLITQFDRRTTAHRFMSEEIAEQAAALGMTVLDPPIRRSITLEELQITGGSIYDTRSGASEDYQRIIDTVQRQLKGA